MRAALIHMPTRPEVSRNAIIFSLSSRMRTGVPSAFSSLESAAGIQYCRISSPIGVPGPARVIVFVLIGHGSAFLPTSPEREA